MISEIDSNLLGHPLDGFGHQCNCFHVMGGGIALAIRNKYPEAYKADVAHGLSGDRNRLGTFSWVKSWDDKIIYNIYGQYDFGDGRRTNYEALYTGLRAVEKHALEANVKSLGFPKNMGCKLAGGSWRIVRALIEDVFIDSPIDVTICNYG